MALMAKNTGNSLDFTPVPQGTHLAICNMVVDLGLQESTFDGKTSLKHQAYVRWELPKKRMEWTDADGKNQEGPMVIGKTYTISLHEKANLRKDLESWRGKAFTPDELEGFDLFKLLGVGCQVSVMHKDKQGGGFYANVATVAGWPDGLPSPDNVECPLLKYSDDDTGQLPDLPERLRNKIAAQKKVEPMVGGPAYQQNDPGAGSSDDYGADPLEGDSIPF